jgi:hypothetical protein
MALISINAPGWSCTFTSPPSEFAPSNSPVSISVSRDGYNASATATTTVDTLVITKRVRNPYPSQATLTSDQAAISDYVYATDVIAGVTNNSTEVSPKPIANWVMPHRQVVGNTIRLEIVAFHRNARQGKQVAAVKFIATDGTTTVSQVVSSTVISNRVGDKNPVIVYQCDIDTSTLATGLITCNAEVYPHIGVTASIAKSTDSAIAREFSPRYFQKNTTLLASPPFAYVSTTGNDGTGVVSTNATTASATPFLTVLGAINGIHTALSATTGIDGAIIRIGNDGGTPFVLGSTAATRTQKIGCLTITRDPNVARANARVSFGAASFRARFGGSLVSPLTTGAIRFSDLSIVRTGTQAFTGEAATQLEVIFEDVDFANAANNATWLSNAHDYSYGVTFTGITASPLNAGTAGEHRILRGASCTTTASTEGWLVIGCAFSSSTNTTALVIGTRIESGSVVAYSIFTGVASTNRLWSVGFSLATVNTAFVQNVCEYTSASQAPMIGICNDSATGSTTHAVLHNNTFTGAWQAGRWNSFYDDGSTRRTNKLHSVIGNIAVSIYTKSDIFRGANEAGADAASAVGNWAFMHGTGCQGNFTQYMANDAVGSLGGQSQDYSGLGTINGTSQTVRNDPLFTNNQGTTYNGTVYTAGAGGGTYSLLSNSPAKGIVSTGVLSHDLLGVARQPVIETSGAYTILASSNSGRSMLMGCG